MEQTKGVFVFVVCGAKEHIDTIHFSLKALTRFAENEIVVVTDSSRNEIEVKHTCILDIKAPAHFDNHQASIYLKTGLHKFLPKGKLYCYLDTDVIALSRSVNSIFEQKRGIILFAPDHTQMKRFSPYAVHCGCLSKNQNEWNELEELLSRYDTSTETIADEMLPKQEMLRKKFEFIKNSLFDMAQMGVKYVLPWKILQLDEDTFYDKRKKYWFNALGKPILYEYPPNVIEQIESSSQWRWNKLKRRWISPSGKDIHLLECNHLREKIREKFGIQISNNNWQHWNGGVFLFDDNSHPFMEAWHSKTLKVFEDKAWKTRDQGTLIATAWEFGLQREKPLSKHFNFIADYSNPQLMLSADKRFISDDAFRTKYSPAFIHIFHHFGAKDWEVWNWVEQIVGETEPQ
ncbi:MAG: hypothetical protein KIS94_09045 [Chitinophagales bacterium]|nr:hypothetical protein [Chitinophagales bacterium]